MPPGATRETSDLYIQTGKGCEALLADHVERIRKRCDEIIEDPATAEALKPWYRFMCKRPLSNNDYYDTFNRPNVKLIDVSATQGLEAMTEKGFIADGSLPGDLMGLTGLLLGGSVSGSGRWVSTRRPRAQISSSLRSCAHRS